MSGSGDALSFSNPPVREVELSIFFQPIKGLKVTSIAGLVTAIQASFPDTTERFAFAPWNLDELDEEEQMSFRQAGYLPFPWLSFSNDEGMVIGFQSDRFSVQWEFSDGADYPGFAELRDRLLGHFTMFTSHVEEQTESKVLVSHARCEYVNDFGDVSVLRIAALAEGNELEFKAESPDRSHGSIYNRDFRWEEAEEAGSELELFAFSPPDDSTKVTIRSSTRTETPAEGLSNPLIERAHARLIEVFQLVSTDKQRDEWGQQ